MTPKEKALRLCQKFGATTMFSDDNEGMSLSIETAKKCAVIAVDEILSFLQSGKRKDYWIIVKSEIEKL